jgi:hypothetical protein
LADTRSVDAGSGIDLEHSRSYNDPAAIEIIVKWMRGFGDGRT